MAYFDCIVGGSGKGNTVTVTCAEEFAGLTITLSKTGKTYTKTCPSTAPYTVAYYGVENGTYTVSTTVEGQTYAETVVVQDISCVLNYGFNWKLWVDTASQLDSSDYASLSEVLADEEAVRELFLEHACVDYMAEATSSNADLETIINDDYCAKWINNSDYALDFLGANTSIKALMDTADKYGYGEWIITDDTTTPPTWGPKGNVPVMASNTAPYGTASAYQVFDGNASTTASGTDFSYKFVNPICPKSFYCNVSGGTLQASNDGSTWGTPTDDTYYLYLRLHFASSVSPHTIQFYGRELKVSVPTMTSNTAPYGECFTQYSGYGTGTTDPYKVFDNNDSTYFMGASSTATQRYCYDFKNKVRACMGKHKAATSYGGTVKTIRLQYSDDRTTWHDGGTAVSFGTTEGATTFVFGTETEAHRYWCVYLESDGVSSWNTYTVQLWGLDYSEKEFEVGTTKKWLYDHGVELETMTPLYGTSGAAVKGSNSIIIQAGSASSNSYSLIYASLDLTNYLLARAKLGDYFVGSNKTKIVAYSTDFNTRIAEASVLTTDLPNNASLNVSSVNQNSNLSFDLANAANGKAELTEFWLE